MNQRYFFVIALLSLVLSGCFESRSKHDGLVVINVLDTDYYKDCHIKGSINIPFEDIRTCENQIDKNAEIVLYCSNYRCTSSGYAAKQLKQHGFEKVAVYEGGTAEWYQKGFPTEGPHTKGYLTKEVEKVGVEDNIPSISAELLAQKMGHMAA